jgi:HlyD family secretion protein
MIKKISIVILLVASIGAAIWFSDRQTEKQEIQSKTISPSISTITRKQVISGNIYPIREIEVKSVIPGVLETYYVTIGETVKRGDRIAKIKIVSEPSQIENAKLNVRNAEIIFERDMANYERDKNLFDKKVIPAAEFDESVKTYKMSKEQYEYAKNQLHLLQEGYIPSTNVSNVVSATADGTVIDLPLEEGATVAERSMFRDGTNVAVIARLDSFIFKGRVVESDALALKRGMKLTVKLVSIEGFESEAFISKISPKGYLEQGVMKYNIEAVFYIADSMQIYSGLNATAEFVLNERKDVLTLPESCLSFRNDSAFVDVLKTGKFEKTFIKTGISDGLHIEIISGITEDVKVKK